MRHLISSTAVVLCAAALGLCAGCGDKPGKAQEETAQSAESEVRANPAEMARRGKDLFVAVIQASTEREAMGLESLWPVTGGKRHGGDDDIAEVSFPNATEYFKALFDLPKKDAPYVAVDSDLALETENGQSLWSVMLNVDERISDRAPILISANFDCSQLPAKWPAAGLDADKVLTVGTCPLLGNAGIVFVTKGGLVGGLKADKVTLRGIYGDAALTLPTQYLTPKGVVGVKK